MASSHPTADEVVTVSIPAVCARRFRDEVLSEVSMAAEQVMEGVRWLASGRRDDRLDGDLARMRDAHELFAQVDGWTGGEIEVRAGRDDLAGLLRCCVRSAVEDLREHVEDDWTPAGVHAATAEIDAWATLFGVETFSTSQGEREA